MTEDARPRSPLEAGPSAVDRTALTFSRPGGSLITAVESVRTLPTNRAVFPYAKIMYIMDGRADVETAEGTHRLPTGASFALGPHRWCRIRPRQSVRIWTVFADEDFLRKQMSWILPYNKRVERGVHPSEWGGEPRVLHPGLALLRTIEPIWRQLSVLRDSTDTPEVVAVRTVRLFATAVESILPTLLDVARTDRPLTQARPPVAGHLTDSSAVGQIGLAIRLLRERMHEPWTVTKIASAVAVSPAHLTRLFVSHAGVAPMRFLTEVRLTEFTRLIEETEFSIARAANAVGWADPRVASAWFHRRFGLTPTQYRRSPHPHYADKGGA